MTYIHQRLNDLAYRAENRPGGRCCHVLVKELAQECGNKDMVRFIDHLGAKFALMSYTGDSD